MLYDRPVRELLRECVRSLDEPFTKATVLSWFRRHYPSVQPSTVSAHMAGLTEGANPDNFPGLARYRPVVRRVGRGLYVRANGLDASSGTPAVRVAAVPSPVAPVTPSAPGAERADIVLVGCVKSKARHPALARDLYTSPLFARRRGYAEASGRRWYIVSSRWGLVTPDELIAPYDMYLADQPASYRRAWGAFLAAQLESVEGPLRGRVVEVHAGDAYVTALRGPLEAAGARVIDPVDARSMGETLSWYDDLRVRRVSPDAVAVEDALRVLAERDGAVPAASLAQNMSASHDAPGLYAWWVDEQGSRDLSAGLGLPIATGLIYAGQAGATRWPSGKTSASTLRTRLVDMHLNGRAEFSTFRRTLAACLAVPLRLVDVDDVRLGSWMLEHLAVTVWVADDGQNLASLEERVLVTLDPPLNLRGMQETPVRTRLRTLRRSHG